jgi:hypothetical protein
LSMFGYQLSPSALSTWKEQRMWVNKLIVNFSWCNVRTCWAFDSSVTKWVNPCLRKIGTYPGLEIVVWNQNFTVKAECMDSGVHISTTNL